MSLEGVTYRCDRGMMSQGPRAWPAVGINRWSPCATLPTQALQRGRCTQCVLETSLLNQPVFAHLSLGGVFLIVRALMVLYTNGALLSPSFNIYELVFEAPSFSTSNLITVPFDLPPFSKLSHNPYRNQDNIYNLAARNLGFSKSPAQTSRSTNCLWN